MTKIVETTSNSFNALYNKTSLIIGVKNDTINRGKNYNRLFFNRF